MNFDLFHLSTLAGLLLAAFLVLWHWQSPFARKLPIYFFLLYGIFVAFLQPIGVMTIYSYAFQASAAKFVLCLMIVPALVSAVPALSNLCLVIIAINSWLAPWSQGMFIGTTHSTLVAAIFFPLFFKSYRLSVLAVPTLASILYVQGVASYAVLLVHLFFFVYDSRYYRFAVGALLAGICGLRFYFPREEFLAGSRITDIWAPAFRWWYAHANQWIGTGPMSYEWLSPMFGAPRMWMHSDWLQIFFETGILGLTCAFLIYFVSLWRVRAYPVALSILLGLGVGMTVYSPMQFFVVWFLSLWTVREYGNRTKPA